MNTLIIVLVAVTLTFHIFEKRLEKALGKLDEIKTMKEKK